MSERSTSELCPAPQSVDAQPQNYILDLMKLNTKYKLYNIDRIGCHFRQIKSSSNSLCIQK